MSNLSDQNVYFDNFIVNITAGNIIEEDHYYSFGLKIAAISSKKLGDNNEGYLTNNYQYQGAFSEMDVDIGWNDFQLRNYDPQIGRWVQQDPYDQFASSYTGMGNDPIGNIDPSGGDVLEGISLGMKVVMGAVLGGSLGIAADAALGGDGIKGGAIGAAVGALVPGAMEVTLRIAVSMGLHSVASAGEILRYTSRTIPAGQAIVNLEIVDDNSPTWASKGPFKVHQTANRNSLLRNQDSRNLALSYLIKLKALNDATVWSDADDRQKGEYSYMHAMRDDDPGGKQTVEQAKEKADQYVREQFEMAKKLLKEGNIYQAYYEFGKGLHSLQDATSPAHAGFQPWVTNPSRLMEVRHIAQELFYPGMDSNLQNVTNKYLDWFEHSNAPLPKDNLFNNINADK